MPRKSFYQTIAKACLWAVTIPAVRAQDLPTASEWLDFMPTPSPTVPASDLAAMIADVRTEVSYLTWGLAAFAALAFTAIGYEMIYHNGWCDKVTGDPSETTSLTGGVGSNENAADIL